MLKIYEIDESLSKGYCIISITQEWMAGHKVTKATFCGYWIKIQLWAAHWQPAHPKCINVYELFVNYRISLKIDVLCSIGNDNHEILPLENYSLPQRFRKKPKKCACRIHHPASRIEIFRIPDVIEYQF